MSYGLHLLSLVGIYATAALALNLVVGYRGLTSLAHAAPFSCGAYAFTLALLVGGRSPLASLSIAASAGFGMGLLFGFLSRRFRGDDFSLMSLALQSLIFSVVTNWFTPGAPLGSMANLTNGTYGISLVGSANSWTSTLLPAIGVLGLCLTLLGVLVHSPWGRLVQAVREDETLALTLGKPTARLTLEVISLSGLLAGVAGGLYASHVRYVDPSLASLDESVLVLAMVLIGGSGTLKGPPIGAGLLLLAPEVLRLLGLPVAVAANTRALLYGLLLVLFMHLRPRGIAGSYGPE